MILPNRLLLPVLLTLLSAACGTDPATTAREAPRAAAPEPARAGASGGPVALSPEEKLYRMEIERRQAEARRRAAIRRELDKLLRGKKDREE